MMKEEPKAAVYEEELEKEVLLDESGLISINLQQGEANPGEPGIMIREEHLDKGIFTSEYLSNRRLSRAISADYFRRKHLSQSAVNEAKAHYIGCHRRLSRAYFSSAMAGLK